MQLYIFAKLFKINAFFYREKSFANDNKNLLFLFISLRRIFYSGFADFYFFNLSIILLLPCMKTCGSGSGWIWLCRSDPDPVFISFFSLPPFFIFFLSFFLWSCFPLLHIYILFVQEFLAWYIQMDKTFWLTETFFLISYFLLKFWDCHQVHWFPCFHAWYLY